jgi:hypothetical protein
MDGAWPRVNRDTAVLCPDHLSGAALCYAPATSRRLRSLIRPTLLKYRRVEPMAAAGVLTRPAPVVSRRLAHDSLMDRR